jgi:tetratricopeptide (TPR) repeat protein
MRAFEKPLERVADAFRVFVGSPRTRVLHIRADHRILPTVCGLIAALEERANNTSPLLLAMTPAEEGTNHWQARSEELRREYEDLRATALENDIPLRMLEDESASGLEGCARTIRCILESTIAPLTAPIVCFIPGAQGSDAFRDDLRVLLAANALQALRVIVLESDVAKDADALPFGAPTMSLVAEVDAGEVAGELNALAAMSEAVRASSHPERSHTSGAGPGVTAPRRPHEPMRGASSDAVRAAGMHPSQVDVVVGASIRAALFRGAAAALRGDVADAIRAFGQARDLAVEADLIGDAVTYEMMMASTAMQSAPDAAIAAFERARLRAERAGLQEIAGRAELGRASALFAMGRRDEAHAAYRGAATLTQVAQPILAIESLRMAGTIDAQAGRDGEAAALWHEALELGRRGDPTVLLHSSAPLAARTLADLCESHRLYEQALSLREEADRMELRVASSRKHATEESAGR